MSTIDRPESRVVPPLVEGERLDRATFHERYEAMPPDTRAELVGGIVFLTPPHRIAHGELCGTVSYWLSLFKQATRGLRNAGRVTILLDDENEVEPDCGLRILEKHGGRTWVEGDSLAGPPELIVEVAQTSHELDLGSKKLAYERAGVLEYVVISLKPNEVHWFIRRDNRFVEAPPGAGGLYHSRVFPGLWLDPQALFYDDIESLIEVLKCGLATPEHAAFVAQLAEYEADHGSA